MLTDILVNVTHAAVVVFGLLTLLWAISVAARDASLIDIFWGFGFLIVAAVCLYISDVKTPYLILLASLPILWGIRLSLYLGKRNLGHGEDARYVAMRKRAAKKGMNEMAWRMRSLFTIYFGQGVLIMIISAPIWVAMASSTSFDIPEFPEHTGYGGRSDEQLAAMIGPFTTLGAMLWFIGFLFEAIGDWQLSKFMKKMKSYDGPYEDKPVLDTGLWNYTRHPN